MPIWLTKENATFVIAVAGFAMSLASWIRIVWFDRKRLKISLDFHSTYMASFLSSRYLNAIIAVSIENKSSNPIAITSIEIQTRTNDRYRANLTPGYVAHNWRRDIDPGVSCYERFIESVEFPIQICAFGAAYEYVIFSLPNERDWNDIEMVCVRTNRGKVFISDHDVICKLQEFLKTPLREKLEKREVRQEPVEIR